MILFLLPFYFMCSGQTKRHEINVVNRIAAWGKPVDNHLLAYHPNPWQLPLGGWGDWDKTVVRGYTHHQQNNCS